MYYIINMSLTEHDIKLLLHRFPKFKLSYEIMTHNKVHNANAILAIPEGNSCFAWFTSYNGENICLALEINKNKTIINIKNINTSFMDCLTLGTIFYGTMFTSNKLNCFSIEDIYYYKGKNYMYTPYSNKLELLKHIFTNEICQSALNTSFTIFGVPLIYSNFNLLLNDIQLLPYKISKIKFRFFEKHNSRRIMTMTYFKPATTLDTRYNVQKTKPRTIFKIMAGVEPDIYNLFICKNGNDEFYDTAFVPDYNTSVMMNSLFRNIKENNNLDAIEESDDEDDFEDVREDKYVYLNRSFNIICDYNYKFKRWMPISLASETDNIISSNQLSNII